MVQGPDCGVALIISIMTLGGWNAPGAFWTFCSNVCPRTICALYSNMCWSTQDAVHRNRQLDGCANQCTHRGLLFWSFPSPLASFLSTTASSITRTWSLQPRWTRCRCNDSTFQVLVMLFLPTSMSMALSSFHNFLEFGLPNRSPAKLSFDQTCCFNYGGFQACYWTTWCKNGEPGEFEILPRLFPLPCIFDPWQDRTWTIRNLQISNRRISVERFITNLVWEHPSGHNWTRSYFLWYKTKQNEN